MNTQRVNDAGQHFVDPADVLKDFGGSAGKCLSQHHIDKPDPADKLPMSHYYETEGLTKTICNAASKFVIASLNVDSLRAKFDTHLAPAIAELEKNRTKFHAICIQESYLDVDCDGTNLAEKMLP